MGLIQKRDQQGRIIISLSEAEELVDTYPASLNMFKPEKMVWEFTVGEARFAFTLMEEHDLNYLADRLGEMQQEFLNKKAKVDNQNAIADAKNTTVRGRGDVKTI